MSQPSTTRRGPWGKHLAATIVMGLTVAGPVMAHGPHPATPCPCAADGTCYPKRDTWGFYKTNWRPAPGEKVGRGPTPAGQEAQERLLELPNLIRPLPEQEDLRGPAKPTRPAAVNTEVNAASPENGPAAGGQQPPAGGQLPPAGAQPPANRGEAAPAEAQPLEGLGLPGFGPQGSIQPLPQIEDAPPALPSGLNRALTALPNANSATASRTTVVANPVRPAASSLPVANSNYVTPVSNTQRIELANPAAKNVQKSMNQDLEQAIYLETTDLTSGN
jgi:hypothetical protein